MRERHFGRGRARAIVQEDLEIMPLMNLFVAMIPMLLISAVFLNVTVIDMAAPPDAADAGGNKKESLALAVTIKDNYFVVEGRGIKKSVIARADADAEDQLAQVLNNISVDHPDNTSIMIISQPDTNYGDIVAVMDISRDNGMPGVSLLGAN